MSIARIVRAFCLEYYVGGRFFVITLLVFDCGLALVHEPRLARPVSEWQPPMANLSNFLHRQRFETETGSDVSVLISETSLTIVNRQSGQKKNAVLETINVRSTVIDYRIGSALVKVTRGF